MENETLTEKEIEILRHWSMWGSTGYPISKVGRSWHVEGYPTTYRTKREAVAQWERRIDFLLAKKAGR